MQWARIFAATGVVTLALGTAAYAAPGIDAAAIAAGRLYVVGTTDQPHTSVSLDGKYTAESDDKGKFQFELVYHPSSCVVAATIGTKTFYAHVDQCSEKCEPERVAAAQPAPGKAQPPSVTPAAERSAALQAPLSEALPQNSAMAVPSSPARTGTLPVQPPLVASPIAHPPLPPQRPAVLSAMKPAAPMRAALPPTPASEPKLKTPQRREEAPGEPARQEQPDDPEQPDDLQ